MPTREVASPAKAPVPARACTGKAPRARQHRAVGRLSTGCCPAQRDLEGRIRRARELELAEGLREPEVSGEPDERTRRRQVRAMALHDAGVAVARGGFAAGRAGTCSRRVVLMPEQAEQLELDDDEVLELPPR